MPQIFELLVKIIMVVIFLFSAIYTSGVIWRVEKKLDTAYKLFLLSIIFFITSEILAFSGNNNPLYILIARDLAKILFALFFLIGILEMRSLIRHIDGEK